MIQSPVFWLTLVISAVVYWQLAPKWRMGFVALVSYGYLASLEPMSVTIVIAWVLVTFYLAPQAIADRRYASLVLPGLITALLGYLFYHKYLDQFKSLFDFEVSTQGIIVPLGISYFTFKLIHYAIEVSRGNIQDRSLSKFFCYMFLFPIFTAGPIERFDHFVANIEDKWDLQSTVEGATRIVHGLIKVFVIGYFLRPDVVAQFVGSGIPESVGELVENLDRLQAYQVWGFLILTYLVAYLDFSAYSDIAIGGSRLFGFRIMENFNFPIFARNIADFWRRWHMTLANWCQSYVYLPVIGRTRSPYAAAYCTFIAMGLWHGATTSWLMWGLYHASGVSFYLTWNKFKRQRGWRDPKTGLLPYLGIPITFAFVTGSYAFSSTGHGGRQSINVFAKLFGVDLGL